MSHIFVTMNSCQLNMDSFDQLLKMVYLRRINQTKDY
jgi:hypothetical protein